MTEAMPFLQNYDITFLRPPPIRRGNFLLQSKILLQKRLHGLAHSGV